MRDDLLFDIKQLGSNITDLMSIIKISSLNNTSRVKKGNSFIKTVFDEYGNKMSQHGNTTDEIEWNELTANEFVTSIQTTIGNTPI